MENTLSHSIRIAVFEWLNSLQFIYPDSIFPSRILANDFFYKNEHVILTGQTGIWKPKHMQLPITIKSTLQSIYDDQNVSNHSINYKYMGTDPQNWMNKGLRECMKSKYMTKNLQYL
jgi:hypothetical protein